MNVLLGCHSWADDSMHDAVVVEMSELFVKELENYHATFRRTKLLFEQLYSFELHNYRLSIPDVVDEVWDARDDLELLSTVLHEQGLDAEPDMHGPEVPFPVVTDSGFNYSFMANDAYGNEVVYETNEFTLEDVRKVLKL